jgi:peptide/nickel transport system permease protein
MHLDRPAPVRYLQWLGGVAHGDFGQSAIANQPVWDLIFGRVVNSAILALATVLLLIPLALLLGVLAAIRAGRLLDHTISSLSLAITALPEFVTGTLLVLLIAVKLKLLPPVSLILPGQTPFDQPSILVLPIATLLAASLAQSIRMVRAGMVDVLRTDYVQMARLNGFPERRVVLRYALRNALAPSVQVIALNVQYLVGGIVVTEYVFGYPGLGQGLVQAVAARDIPLVQSVALLLAAVFLAINIVADLLVVLLIPKLRTAQ